MPSRSPARALLVIIGVALTVAARSVQAQDTVVTGPPPEIRALVTAVVKGLNSSAAEWEALAKERFTPDLLAGRPAEERAKVHEQFRKDFGTVTVERVMRRGPDAPLELQVKGSTGLSGVVSIDVTESSPPRISGLAIDTGTGPRGRDAEPPRDGPAPPPINGSMPDAEISAALDSYLAKLAADDTFSGVALVAKNGVPVFQKAYGYADRANRLANTPATRFNIGSINKTFTRMAIDQLIAAKKLTSSDTLGSFFPDYPQAMSRPATIAQLLNHTGGLADFFGPAFSQASKDRFRSNADFFRFVGSQPPLFAPGSRNQYCNGCYIALGAIVERVAGVPYEQYVSEQVFKRADMTSTGYLQADAINANVAVGYTRGEDGGQLRSNVFLHGATGSAAGGGYSTAADLLAFASAQRDGRLPNGGMMRIAGGAPGTSATLQTEGPWTVVVLTNLDPPTGEGIGSAIMDRLIAAR